MFLLISDVLLGLAIWFLPQTLPTALAALKCDAALKITNAMISPDGFRRSAILAGDVYPSPLIQANKGDQFSINVTDLLTDDTMLRSTSIHWHGLYQNKTNWADGVASVSQCPITPGKSFLYKFAAKNQAGTFWYHSHFGAQYCDGLRGPLVIYDPQDPHKHRYDVDDESTVITVGDWYHLPSPSITGIVKSDSTLINGRGRYPGGPQVPLSIINVEHGKRYRIRLVSISCDPNYTFSIDNHELLIIEADGENTRPLKVNSIQIWAGQRYSFVLKANQPINSYWIRALPNIGNGLADGFTGGINSAVLRYKGAKHADPTTKLQTVINPLVETSLRPLKNPAAPGRPYIGGADVNINLSFSFNRTVFAFFVNGKSFIPPTIPVLLQIMSGAHTAQELLPEGSVYALPRNKVIEVSMPAGVVGGPHPLHLHGHVFSVVRSAGNDTKPNFVDPVRRDVVSIGNAGSNVTIRFVTNNAGPWFLHCHIDWHLTRGLAVVFAEDTLRTPKHDKTPAEWNTLCPQFNSLPASQTSIRLVPSPSMINYTTPVKPP